MDVGGGGTGGAGSGEAQSSSASAISQWAFTISRRYQHLLDKSTPQVFYRWIFLLMIAIIYAIRVYLVQGFYVITYGLGIYVLQLLIAFLSPQVDPEIQDLTEDGPSLPTRGSDEFRPFVRRLPEFKFWECNMRNMQWHDADINSSKTSGRYSLTKAFCIAFVLTFFSAFDVPVFWPILLFYWLVLFISTMKRQIMHMIKYRYVPFTFGKQRYTGKKVASADDASTARP